MSSSASLSAQLNPLCRTRGFTLIELMVAIVLGLFVVGATMTVFMTTFAANSNNLKATRLNQELRAIMDLVAGDLRRSGHWGFAANSVISSLGDSITLSALSGTVNISGTPPRILMDLGLAATGLKFYTRAPGAVYRGTINATSDTTFTMTLNALDGTLPMTTFPPESWAVVSDTFNAFSIVDLTGNDCVLYRADLNGDGALTPANPDERLGLRYDAAVLAIQRRVGGIDCMGMGGGRWDNLSDERSVEITRFEVNERLVTRNLDATGKLQIQVRELEVRLGGRLVGNPEVQRELLQVVSARNDRMLVN